MSRRPAAAFLAVFIAAALLAMAGSGCSLVSQELPNEPPVLQVSSADTTRVARGGIVNLQVRASDADDDPLKYTWSSYGAGAFTDTASAQTQWIAPARISGSSASYVLTVTISDQQPETEDVVQSFVIEVVQNIPRLAAPADTTAPFRSPAIVLEASATDADGDPLTFAWEVLEGGNPSLSVEQPGPGLSRARLVTLYPGTFTLRVAVTDGSDTVRADIRVAAEAVEPPADGMVSAQIATITGGTRTYEIDVYEYPNQRGSAPTLAENWFQAAALCARQGKRLCTAAEWENACRGPEGGQYSSSDDPADWPASFGRRFCNTAGSEVAGQQPTETDLAAAGSFPNCASSVGAYDMTGNALEWVERQGPLGGDEGRYGRFIYSSVTIRGDCGTFSTELPPVPLADRFDVENQAQIDSLLRSPTYSAYGQSGVGFRCCR
ncbi:MAG: SUMF1/EgtB/PvdO family nonheme iron enzyme [Gemmatimonadota bacterium]